jgi:DNA-binding LacI/PurR family transcriptional regulator
MTVSNAFSRPDQLSAELRERILAVADELGYTGPDPAARALARGTAGAVGVLLTDSLDYAFSDEIATRLLAAISTELAATGLGLTLLTSVEHPDFLPARDIPMDGALVYSCETTSVSVDWLKKRKLPLVFVDQRPVGGATCVNVDDRGGARAAAQHLLDLGHRRIAAVTCVRGAPPGRVGVEEVTAAAHSVAARMLGWLDALEPAGVTPVVINAVHDAQEAGLAAAGRLLADPTERPTAILAFCDTLAAGILACADEHGVSVPGELSVVGFDDAPLATRARPQLTTVHQDVTAKGRAAAAALTEAIRHGRTWPQPDSDRILLPTHLVVRASTAPAATP